MFDSAIIDVAIGVILIFLVTSVAASAIVEGVGGFLHRRSKNLWDTIDLLLEHATDINGKQVVDTLYQQPGMKTLVRPSQRAFFDPTTTKTTKTYRVHPKKKGKKKVPWRAEPSKIGIQTRATEPEQTLRRYYGPDHVDAVNFASSLVTIARPQGSATEAIADVRDWVDKQLPEGGLKTHLQGHLARAGEDLSEFQTAIAEWYERHMAAVSQWYRKQTRWFLFIAGLILAASLNLDGVHAATTLYRDEAVREAVVAEAVALEGVACSSEADDSQSLADCLHANIDGSVTLPIGWDNAEAPDATGWLIRLLGWGSVAAAATLGAPFWFDLLRRALDVKRQHGART